MSEATPLNTCLIEIVVYVYVIARAGVIFGIYFTSCRYSGGYVNRMRRSRVLFRRSTENKWNISQNFTTARAIIY